jgi:hypothetical protein
LPPEALSFLGQSTVQQTDDEIALKMAQGKASLRKFALRQKSLWQQVFSFWDQWLGLEPSDASIDVDINVLDKPVTPQEVQIILDNVANQVINIDVANAKLHQLRWLPEGFDLTVDMAKAMMAKDGREQIPKQGSFANSFGLDALLKGFLSGVYTEKDMFDKLDEIRYGKLKDEIAPPAIEPSGGV